METRCILLHGRRDDGIPAVPHALMSSLQRKPLQLTHCQCPCDAMAKTVLRHQDHLEGQADEPTIVLIVEPSTIAGAWDLAAAIHAHCPFAVCWLFESNHTPRLRQYTDADHPSVRTEPAAAPETPRGPELRLTDADAWPPTAEPHVELAPSLDLAMLADDTRTPQQALTRDELEMLLRHDPADQTHNAGGEST